MAYLFRQKLKLSDLVELKQREKRLVLAEPEEYRLSLYASYLSAHSFTVSPCGSIDQLWHCVSVQDPHLLLLSSEFHGHIRNTAVLLVKLRKQFPALPIVTLGYDIGAESLKELMSAGISSHVDRRFSRPEDLVHIVKAVLNNQ